MSDLLVNDLMNNPAITDIPAGYKDTKKYPFRPVRCLVDDLNKKI